MLEHVYRHGTDRVDRTGTGTRSVFGYQARYDLREGFPLLTTKKVHFKSVAYELLWFLRGDTNIRFLKEHNVRIWDEWADATGELGPVYGKQWKRWGPGAIDQIEGLVRALRADPFSRRHVVSAWNVDDLDKMALPPCHVLFQFYVSDNKLSCSLYQRSADVFLGVPFNIASYSLLTHMIARVCGFGMGEFIHSIGDLHLYRNHLTQAQLQLSRQPGPLPSLTLPDKTRLADFVYEDFTLRDYHPQPAIPAEVSV